MAGLLVIERILRDREGIWEQIADERDLNQLTIQMLTSSAVALAIYGAVLGSFNSVLMSLTSTVKLPLLFLVTLAICLPALYLFNLVFGARLSLRQALALVMVAITVISMLSLAFVPISLFFRITAPDYEFFKILNVGILALTAFVGLRFLTSGMAALNERTPPAVVVDAVPELERVGAGVGTVAVAGDGHGHGHGHGGGGGGAATVALPAQPAATVALAAQPAGTVALPAQPAGWSAPVPRPGGRTAEPERSGSMALLYVWILLFGFVGTQLAWTLRPFFGAPTEDFALFRNIEGNFYAAIFTAIGRLFS